MSAAQHRAGAVGAAEPAQPQVNPWRLNIANPAWATRADGDVTEKTSSNHGDVQRKSSNSMTSAASIQESQSNSLAIALIMLSG